jgi:WhiB family redox-sensing transcriptional regulator
MDYSSRKLTMPRLILPAPAVPERGRDAAWRESAACLGADTELFFPVGFTGPAAADIRTAKAFCERCSVRVCCLTYALDTGQTAGIWGGYDENERRLMRQGLRRSGLTRGPA